MTGIPGKLVHFCRLDATSLVYVLKVVDTYAVAASVGEAQVKPTIERSCRRPRVDVNDFAGGDRGDCLGFFLCAPCA